MPVDYIGEVLCPEKLKELVEDCIYLIKDLEYDGIVCIGNSGTLFASALSYKTEKPIILVRKKMKILMQVFVLTSMRGSSTN